MVPRGLPYERAVVAAPLARRRIQVTRTLTAIIEREGDLYVATCPHFDVVTQGSTIQEARDNLKEAVELFMECASPAEKLAREAG